MLSIIPYFFLLGSNLIKVSAFFMFISVIITIIFMILCYQFMDYPGLAYGKLFSSIVSIPLMLSFIHYRIIDKKNLFSGIKVYLPAGLLALSIYMLNLISIPLFIGGVALLWLLYKENVTKFQI
jgi:hypothetical protein